MQKHQIQFSRKQLIYLKIKRLLDILCSLIGMVLLAPLFLVVAAAIKVEDPSGSVFYHQERIGRSGRVFKLHKFRSMRVGAPVLSTSEFCNAQSYITQVGKFIRHTSIDELPQLWNVFNGHMSLVGPRPLLSQERDVHMKRFLYGIYQVRPGITGMAQTHGRDNMCDDQKVAWDLKYVKELSFSTDLKLVVRTVLKVLQREGVTDQSEEEFEETQIPETESNDTASDRECVMK